jgi:hypothetical protein
LRSAVAYPVGVATLDDNDARKQTRKVLRPTSGYWLAGTLTVVVLVFSIDALVHLDFAYLLTALPWQLLAIWVLYVLLVRPAIVIEPQHLRVINLVRQHDIAWSAIERFGGRYQLIVFLHGGRKIACWGAPATGLDRRIPDDLAAASGYASSRLRARARRSRRINGASTVEIIESIMQDLPLDRSSSQQPVETTVSRYIIVVTAVIAALCIIDGLVTALAH